MTRGAVVFGLPNTLKLGDLLMTINDYRNFDLLITRAGDRYRAFVVDAPAGDASVVFDLPFAADEATSLGGLVRGVTRHVGRLKETSPAAP
jgi:hypothetical protein